MVLHRPVELAHLFGKFDGSGVSGYTGRGLSQALESKVRFADKPEVEWQRAFEPGLAEGEVTQPPSQ